jgi:CHASE3 domain sensor protein
MKSKAQRGYLWANNPKVAKEFESATPKGRKLPQKVKKAKKRG